MLLSAGLAIRRVFANLFEFRSLISVSSCVIMVVCGNSVHLCFLLIYKFPSSPCTYSFMSSADINTVVICLFLVSISNVE